MKVEIVRHILILRPALLITIAITLVMWVVMALCVRRLQIQGAGTRLAGLFVGLSGRSLLHLSAAWMKFAIYTAFLLVAEPVQQIQWLLLGGLALVTLLLRIRLSTLLTEVVGGALMTSGLIVCSTLLRYLRQVRFDKMIYAAYWLLAAFLILCAAAVLLREITSISEERNYFDETGETE